MTTTEISFLENVTGLTLEPNMTLASPNTTPSIMFDDEDSEYVPYNERPETYIVPVLFAIIFVVGVLGNGTLILIFARHRRMRNVPNTYIFSLALGDLILIVTCVPFTSTLYTFESWPYGTFICKLSETVKDLSVGVSVFTLTALSAERYCAIVNPLRRHAGGILGSKTVTMCTAVGIWVVSMIFAVPSAIFSQLREHPLRNNSVLIYCYALPGQIGDTPDKIVIVLKFLVYYAIPLCVIAIFYVLMAFHLEKSAKNMPGEAAHSTQVQARKKVAKMVLSFVVIFFVCFLPYHVFMMWFHLNPKSMEEYDEFWNALRIVGFCLSFLNSCINPIALYFVSGTFRKHFNRHLFCCCCPEELPERVRRNNTYDKSRRNDASSHTLVHFHSSVKRNHEVTVTTAFSLDKT